MTNPQACYVTEEINGPFRKPDDKNGAYATNRTEERISKEDDRITFLSVETTTWTDELTGKVLREPQKARYLLTANATGQISYEATGDTTPEKATFNISDREMGYRNLDKDIIALGNKLLANSEGKQGCIPWDKADSEAYSDLLFAVSTESTARRESTARE